MELKDIKDMMEQWNTIQSRWCGNKGTDECYGQCQKSKWSCPSWKKRSLEFAKEDQVFFDEACTAVYVYHTACWNPLD